MEINDYYSRLYGLQDAVLELAGKSNLKFYLTGGTALSRFYYQHRYSDDLDFFSLNELNNFIKIIQNFLRVLPNSIVVETDSLTESFARLRLIKDDVALKVDFINDTITRHGSLLQTNSGASVDNELNILTNKLSAIQRQEVKDVVDIWAIAKHCEFVWKDMAEITEKKAAIDPLTISKTINSMPVDELNIIKWAQPVDIALIYSQIKIIAKDILLGSKNSLI